MQNWLHLQANLTLFANPYLHLGMCYIILLLENIDYLVQFAQRNDVFIFAKDNSILCTMMSNFQFLVISYGHLEILC
jgi:hypothetical protein